VYKIKEYVAAINAIIAIGTIFAMEKNMLDEISMISLAKLIDGGAAMLQAEKQNHQNVSEGNKVKNPEVT